VTTDPIVFVVPGDPVPQPRPSITMRGGFGQAYVPRDHRIHVYRLAIHCAALAQSRGRQITGPVIVEIFAAFARPKSHWRADGLSKDAPVLPPKADVDNVAKGILDALTTSKIWTDDAQVGDLVVRKRYVPRGGAAHTLITVRPLCLTGKTPEAAPL